MKKISDLASVVELDRSPELHKSYPCEFFQNTNLSPDALALGGYLHSLPNTWTPRPFQLKEHFGWGKHKWNKACGDLRKEGYMFLLANPSGSRLYFSIEKNPPRQNNKIIPLHDPLSKNRTVAYPQATVRLSATGKSDCLEGMKEIRSKLTTTNIVPTNPKEADMSQGNVVVNEKLVSELKEIGIASKTAELWVKQHGERYLRQKINMMAKDANIRNRAGWLNAAVTENYPASPQRGEPRRKGEQAQTHIPKSEYGQHVKLSEERERLAALVDPAIPTSELKTIRETLNIENSKNLMGRRVDRAATGT